MSGRNSALRGRTIKLTAVFVDAGNNAVEPEDITLSIFPPGHSPESGGDEDDAWVWEATLVSGGSGPHSSSNVVVCEALGIYYYVLTVPEDSDFGTAFDNWTGTIDNVPLDETFNFTIVGGGSIGTDVVSEARKVTVVWTPQGTDDLAVQSLCSIDHSEFNLADFERKFSLVHPSAYRRAEDRFNKLVEIARERVNHTLACSGLSLEKVVDGDALIPILTAFVWMLILEDTGESGAMEFERAREAYVRELDLIKSMVIWADLDEDKANDEGEKMVTSSYTYCRGF
jgi:hypothetical protein